MAVRWARLKSYLSSLWKRNFRFSKRGFCILGLVFGSAMAEYSFLGFFIVFLNEKLDREENMRYDAVVSNIKDSLSAILASFLAYTAPQRISSLVKILLTYLLFITGMLVLGFTSQPSDGILYFALVLLSMDRSGEEYLDEFAADRHAVDDLTQGINDNRRDAWMLIGRAAGALIGSLVIAQLSSKLMLMISAIVMGIGCIFFFSYCIYYELTSGDHHQEDKRELRPLLKLLPLWAPFLFYYVVDAAASTFFLIQAEAADLKEVNYLYIIQKGSELILLPLIGRVITKFWSDQQEQQARLAKITCGMFICFWICIDAWHVEVDRLRSYGPDPIIHVIFIRLFVLLGIMKGMVGGMLGKYFRDRVLDQSMHHLEPSFNLFVEGIGYLLSVACIMVFKSWIGKTIESIYLGRYYMVLAIMTLCASLVFVCLTKTCYRMKRTEDDDVLKKLEEGSLQSSPKSSFYYTADDVSMSKRDSESQSPESSVYYSDGESSSLSKLNSNKTTSNSKWSFLRSHLNDLHQRTAAKPNL